MSFPAVVFPLTVDFGGSEYWIGEAGPHKYGEAVTAFFAGEGFAQAESRTDLMEELEVCLKTLGWFLHPYPEKIEITGEMLELLEQSPADCSVNFAFHRVEGGPVLLERYTFSSLRSFLYVELGKAILKGNAPRKCRLCGNWFLHVHGERSMYCSRIAPGEEKQTCRDVGARAVFEKKIQDEDAWKLYKRAYKKYYARVMKGHMDRDEFRSWVETAAVERDAAIEQLTLASDEAVRAFIVGQLKEKLNDR